MAEIGSIAILMKELEKECEPCTRCGMCQANCPVYSQTGRETDTARGKLALIDGLIEEIIEDAKGVEKRLSKCLLCGACASKCPRGIKTNEIIIKARAILAEYSGLSPVKKFIFRKIIAHPKRFDRILFYGSRYQHFFITPKNESTGTSCARFISPVLSDRHVTPLAPVPFHKLISKSKIIKKTIPQNLMKTPRVFYFTGCLIDNLFPEVAEASVRVISHLNMDIHIPEKQACCGIPVLTSGDRKTFMDLVKYNLELFSPDKFDYFVTSCATCASTIKNLWPMIFRNDHSNETISKISRLSEKILDISQLVVRNTQLNLSSSQRIEKDTTPVTYHAPCHLTRSLGVTNEPIRLIQSNPSYTYIKMNNYDRCCGLGGSFNLRHYDISTEIGMQKRGNIISSGANIVATGCPACMIQLGDMLSKKKNALSVKHVIEIYAETLK